ncbi:MAG: ribonuclease III [Epsilonproteobacteria bacterium]|jgi:ribonuclease-3|nr:ribonuclease III [Campylobacterota bacterium]NPA89381.1 ribonuclease III [Campylobacterota bacterium]
MFEEQLEKSLGYRFKREELIAEALTHKSYHKDFNNERLEFLGDAVMDLVVGEYLYHLFPDREEGFLSKLRAALVNETSFAKLAKELNLGQYLRLSHSEENNGGREKASILASGLEAIIGAIYLDGGFEEAKRVGLSLLKKVYPEIDPKKLLQDHKTTLQEITQSYFGVLPEYKLLKSSGPDHDKKFEIGVYIHGKEYARAEGKSKKSAQQKGAKMTIDKLKNELDLKGFDV